MFKLVVLSALFAAAIAEPGVFLTPNTYTSIAAPTITTYVRQAAQYSNYLPAASVYSALPYAHFIKKRSAPFYSNYAAPSTYIAGAPLAAPYASTYITSAPFGATYSSPLLSTYTSPAHFIKKRSAPFYSNYAAPSTFIAGAPLAAPYASTYITSAPFGATYSSPLLSTYTSPAHFIKKRSAPFYSNYVAPSSYIAGVPPAAPYKSVVAPAATTYVRQAAQYNSHSHAVTVY